MNRLQKPIWSGLSQIAIFFIFLFMALCPGLKAVQTQDRQYKKQNILIPWGSGIGQLYLNVEVRKKFTHYGSNGMPVYNGSVSDIFGPNFLGIDGNENFYFYEKSKSVLKKFNSKGEEVASLKTKNFPDGFFIQKNEIITKTNYTNKITILDEKNLSILKEIDVPKSQIDMFHHYRAQIKNGALVSSYSNGKQKAKKTFVFDKNKWDTTGENMYLQEQTEDKKISSILESGQKKWAERTGDSETISWIFLRKDKFNDFYWKGVGVVSPYSGREAKDYLVKTNSGGEILLEMPIEKGDYLSEKIQPVAVDSNGNIYDIWGGKDGVHIDKYQFNENKK